jgi:hypothetical protein
VIEGPLVVICGPVVVIEGPLVVICGPVVMIEGPLVETNGRLRKIDGPFSMTIRPFFRRGGPVVDVRGEAALSPVPSL